MSEARTAIIASDGTFTYDQLDEASRRVAGALLGDNADLNQTRVAFFVPPSFAYAAVQRGIWRAGGVAVPLATSHPPAELEYVIRDAAVSHVVAEPSAAPVLAPLAQAAGVRFVTTEDALATPPSAHLPHVGAPRRAMIVYTSGTTGRPKGVVTTHSTIGAQISALVEAWAWSPSDRLLLVLPLHHVHGIINGLGSALAVRAACEIQPTFDAEAVWERLASGEPTLFMAVPTIYRK
jgi:malonyl-CoA/methylmalonyl-CoA synthetase